jgi:hypothetical protein
MIRLYPEGLCPGDRNTAPRFFSVGGDDRRIDMFVDGLPEVFDSRGCNPVVVGDENEWLHL